MSSVAADQILKVVAPAPPKADALRPDAPRDGVFDRHLEQAAAAAKPERPKSAAPSVEEQAEVEHTTVSNQSEEDSAQTAEDGFVEAVENNEETSDEAVTVEQDDADELELSSAAVAAVEAGAVLDGVIVVEREAAEILSVAEVGGGQVEQLPQQTGEAFNPVDAQTATAQQFETTEAGTVEAGVGVVDTTEQSVQAATVRPLSQEDAPTEEVVAKEEERLEVENDPAASVEEPNAVPAEESDLELESEEDPPTTAVAEEVGATGQPPTAAVASEQPPTEEKPKQADSPKQLVAAEKTAVEEKPETEVRRIRKEPQAPHQHATQGGTENSAATLRPGEAPAPASSGVSAGPNDPGPTPTVDRNRFVQRVSNAFRMAQQRDGEIQLRLSPPELGSLKIQISVQHGALTAKLETETSAARNAILDNLPALRERLAEQDIRIEKFDVDVRRDGGQNFDNQETQQQQQRDNAARSANRLPTAPNGRQVFGTVADATAASAVDGRLDIRI